jgi:hypothetical protein
MKNSYNTRSNCKSISGSIIIPPQMGGGKSLQALAKTYYLMAGSRLGAAPAAYFENILCGNAIKPDTFILPDIGPLEKRW